jgi:hypothetical protein
MTDRLAHALAAFDAENARDPTSERDGDTLVPTQLLHARRVSAWLARIAPDAQEPLRLAARCQHLKRWHIARDSYPQGRTGYLQWREALARFHASEADKILGELGYDEGVRKRVSELVRKKKLRHDPEAQLLEDAICCTFLEFEAAPFAQKHPADKVVDILVKTLAKMGPRGRSLVLHACGRAEVDAAVAPGTVLALPAGVLALLERALSSAPPAQPLDDDR